MATRASYEAYLESQYPLLTSGVDAEARADDIQERNARLAAFPHSVVLALAYPELDYANRWCWQQFGPASGECQQAGSEYPACHLGTPHAHHGRWLTYWLIKTDYDFGFNEWYFVSQADWERFLEFVPQITWGESYPK